MSEEVDQTTERERDMVQASTSETPAWLSIFDWQIPFAILILVLFVANVIQFSTLSDQSNQLNRVKGQFDRELPQAKEIQGRLEALARDIVELAKTDPEARQVQDDLKLQIHDAPGATQAPPAK